MRGNLVDEINGASALDELNHDVRDEGQQEVADDEDSVPSVLVYNTSTELKEENVEESHFNSIAKTGNTSIRFFRIIFLLVIALTAVFVSMLTYRILSDAQNKDFEDALKGYANDVQTRATASGQSAYFGMAFLSQKITAETVEKPDVEFPFVTLPLFDLHATQTRYLTKYELLCYAPLVTRDQLEQWQNYSVSHQTWISDILLRNGSISSPPTENNLIRPFVFDEKDGIIQPSEKVGEFYAPLWQTWPLLDSKAYNFNLFSSEQVVRAFDVMFASRTSVFSADFAGIAELTPLSADSDVHAALHEPFQPEDNRFDALDFPHVEIAHPVFDKIYSVDSVPGEEAKIVGFLLAISPLDVFIAELLPDGARPVIGVVKNTMGYQYIYRIEGQMSVYLGDEAESYTSNYRDCSIDVDLAALYQDIPAEYNIARYSITLYPTKELEDTFRNHLPLVLSFVVASTFVFVGLAFFLYDLYVRRRNHFVSSAAAASDAIVTSMFPSTVRERLYADVAKSKQQEVSSTKTDLSQFLMSTEKEANQTNGEDIFKTKPIADLFPETTIMFADIAGFTAWSSAREPFQVFILLETLYNAFDDIATARRVYKVETVGDCYVAVCGLPSPRKDHAVCMSRFARDCVKQMHRVSRRLEMVLGPDTAELSIRVGLHSGAVTAGVLRGKRSRFQLFGDTVNTAARMEHTGAPGKIQISGDTASLLQKAGKDYWLEERENVVDVKGKGKMRTYWLATTRSLCRRGSNRSDSGMESGEDVSTTDPFNHDSQPGTSGKIHRLISWNVECLAKLLKQIIARRQLLHRKVEILDETETTTSSTGDFHCSGDVLSEVQEIIRLPPQNIASADLVRAAGGIELSPAVRDQLHDLVSRVAALYHNNPFHNFEHASHVTMSVCKLLSRIVAPSDLSLDASSLHDHTYGITSDPLTQFACVFSALIHDVDHPGVPNTQLVKEDTHLARKYCNKSIAEQNSVDLAWGILMSDDYMDLRNTICACEDEYRRFRQLVVNAVMATDIMDKDLKDLRNKRWDVAFSMRVESRSDTINRKATIVIEHLIQASDVSHTMQHWHVYRKWNERLFEEMLKAYRDGRSTKHPGDGWYEGEIGFFDYYIIPLAKKLKNCGVFGVSSDEYLNYAVRNRAEWEERGRQVVSEMMDKFENNSIHPVGSANRGEADEASIGE